MKIIQRIFQYIDYQNISKSELERKCSVSNGYFAKMKVRNANIGEDIILKVLENCPEISPDWLIFGKGEMLQSDEKTDKNLSVAVKNSEGIPLIPIEAMAGFGRGEIQVLESKCERYVIPVFKGADFLITVKGSSMQPKYNSGDMVACKRIPLQDIFFQWNKVYVLNTIQGTLVKRICKGSDNDHILIVSENPKYDSFELNIREQIYDVAIVIGAVRLE
jgi:phage repressor protein C with HTH and peptisase S24 domain